MVDCWIVKHFVCSSRPNIFFCSRFLIQIVEIKYFIFLLWAEAVLAGENCDARGTLVYEMLGCVPDKLKGNDSCPEKYNCIGLELSKSTCVIKGKIYSLGDKLDESVLNPCDIGCTCGSGFDGYAMFSCAIVDCYFGPAKPGCYRKNSPFVCCPLEENCEPLENRATCEVDGKIYRDGEYFEAKDPDLNCICQPGFTGEFVEPFCRKWICNIQLRGLVVQQKCAPIYSSNLPDSCPLHWACSNGTEKIEGEAKSDHLVCQFGDKLVKKGQRFEKTNYKSDFGKIFEKVICECVAPPLVNCLSVDTN